jgi:hypothetical protein
MTENQNIEPRSDAGQASAEDGLVLLDGPDGLAVTFTADAAIETGKRLIEAGEQARRQRDASR